MMRHLTTLVLTGVLGTLVMTGNAEACHKKRCGCAAPVSCAPVATACPRPVVYRQPAACPRPVVTKSCGHKAAKCGGCGGGLFAKHGHKRNCVYASCPAPVVYNYNCNYGAPVAPSGQMMATPQK
jgi:hypothetical protein